MILSAQPASQSTLRITLRHQIWRVSLDGLFCADYRSRASAEEGAEGAAMSLRARGRLVTIVGVPVAL